MGRVHFFIGGVGSGGASSFRTWAHRANTPRKSGRGTINNRNGGGRVICGRSGGGGASDSRTGDERSDTNKELAALFNLVKTSGVENPCVVGPYWWFCRGRTAFRSRWDVHFLDFVDGGCRIIFCWEFPR